MITKKIINNILGKKIVFDKFSKNQTSISGQLLSLINDYPNDFVVIASRWGSDYRIRGPYTYRSQAESTYNTLLERADSDWKIGIYQLNQNSLKDFL
jgi:hypothetical protein